MRNEESPSLRYSTSNSRIRSSLSAFERRKIVDTAVEVRVEAFAACEMLDRSDLLDCLARERVVGMTVAKVHGELVQLLQSEVAADVSTEDVLVP